MRLSNDNKFLWVDFEDNIRMHLSCVSNNAYIYGAQETTSDRIWLRHVLVDFFLKKINRKPLKDSMQNKMRAFMEVVNSIHFSIFVVNVFKCSLVNSKVLIIEVN